MVEQGPTGRLTDRVAVVTGGGGGIGREVAVELARQGAIVVVMDPGVSTVGEPVGEASAAATVARIEAAGGTAMTSTASVTDREAVRALFAEARRRHGAPDIVVNAAGILRFPTYLEATEADWADVLDVHLGGYLNVVGEALRYMERDGSGRGRIVGFTSGVGLARTLASGPSYAAAKRAVAALTWQLGPMLPGRVAVNALSPIADTRMVRDGLEAAGMSPQGLDLSAMPQPEQMAPAAAMLADENSDWTGRVVFSAGSELSLIAPPRLLEVVRAADGDGLAGALDTVVPEALVPAHRQQRTTGGSNPRFGDVFTGAVPPGVPASGRVCVVVGSEAAGPLTVALGRWGFRVEVVDEAGFDGAEEALARVATTTGRVDAVVHDAGDVGQWSSGDGAWRRIVADHALVGPKLVAAAGWLRAAGRHAVSTGRAVRFVTATTGDSQASTTLGQALTQMCRCANDTPSAVAAEAFAVRAEGLGSPPEAFAALVARLVAAEDVAALRGAELVVGHRWVGLRSHPAPSGTISFGGPEIPRWAVDALGQMIRD